MRLRLGYAKKNMIVISIHALTGSATKMLKFRKIRNYISIHALTGSATLLETHTVDELTHFNPRTHGECDHSPPSIVSLFAIISIHALTGSATAYNQGI